MTQQDIAIIWVGGQGEIKVEGNDLLLDDTLTNAVIISLHTNRAVNNTELEGRSNQGWWGDSYSDENWGSKLWLLEREKSLDSVCELAEDYALEALEWLKQEGFVSDIEVTATRESNEIEQVKNILALDIHLLLPSGATLQRIVKSEF